MTDYDATLKVFFAEVIKYLEKLQAKAPDKVQLNRIKAAIDGVQRVMANPMKYADYNVRVADGLEKDAEGFIPAETNDNAVYLAYAAVVNSMGDLHSEFDYTRKQAQQKLLSALKRMKYKNSKNMLRDITFAFKSPESFAVRSTKQYEI